MFPSMFNFILSNICSHYWRLLLLLHPLLLWLIFQFGSRDPCLLSIQHVHQFPQQYCHQVLRRCASTRIHILLLLFLRTGNENIYGFEFIFQHTNTNIANTYDLEWVIGIPFPILFHKLKVVTGNSCLQSVDWLKSCPLRFPQLFGSIHFKTCRHWFARHQIFTLPLSSPDTRI